MLLYRYWTGHDTIIIIIIIWMYTSELGNKQSTINSYMYFFFPCSHIKRLGETWTQKFYHHQISALFKIFASAGWCFSLLTSQQRTDSDAKPEKGKKNNREKEKKNRVDHWQSWVSILLTGLKVCSWFLILREAPRW